MSLRSSHSHISPSVGRSDARLARLLDWMLGTLGVVDIELRELLPPVNQSELSIHVT